MKLYLIVGILLFIPLVLAIEECEPLQSPLDVPCRVTATWNYSIPCSNHIAVVYNITGNNTINFTYLPATRCYFDWNISKDGSYIYLVTNGDSGGITITRGDEMISLSITLFLIVINALLFITPNFLKFSNDEMTNDIYKKGVWVIAIGMLAFNSSIMFHFAEVANLNIAPQMRMLMQILLYLLYTGTILILFYGILSRIKRLKQKRKDKLMGTDE